MALTGITKIGGAALEDPLMLEGDLHVSGITTFTRTVQAQAGVFGESVIGIQSATTQIGVGVTQLNFIGVGNTFHFDSATNTVDVSIAGGGGAAPGTRLNYPGGSQSPFYHSFARITEDISLDATYIGETVESNVVAAEETITVNTGVALTIGEGKTVIPDLYKIFA